MSYLKTLPAAVVILALAWPAPQALAQGKSGEKKAQHAKAEQKQKPESPGKPDQARGKSDQARNKADQARDKDKVVRAVAKSSPDKSDHGRGAGRFTRDFSER